jgi:hypothetical protein
MVAETASIIDGGHHKHANRLLTLIRLNIYHIFILTIPWSLAMAVCKQIIDDDENAG